MCSLQKEKNNLRFFLFVCFDFHKQILKIKFRECIQIGHDVPHILSTPLDGYKDKLFDNYCL